MKIDDRSADPSERIVHPAELAGVGSARAVARPEVAELERLLAARLDGVPLTRAERAEALVMALGVDAAASAAVSGRAAATVRARRRRIVEKLAAALVARAIAGAGAPDRGDEAAGPATSA